MLDVRDGSVRRAPGAAGEGWASFAPRLRGAGTHARHAWRTTYVRRLVLADAACAAVAGTVGYLARFGPVGTADARLSFWITLVLPFVWVTAMLIARAYEQRFLFVGAEEFRRIASAGVMLLAAVGTV